MDLKRQQELESGANPCLALTLKAYLGNILCASAFLSEMLLL